MSQIEELQGRLAAALDRIGQGLDRGEDEGAGAQELEALRRDLEDERIANEQLRERVKTLRKRRDKLEAELEEARAVTAEAHAESMSALEGEFEGLRAANAKLRETNAKLREANAAGVGEPHLINNAMMAELEALRAAQSADRAEARADLSAALEGADAADNAGQEKSEDA